MKDRAVTATEFKATCLALLDEVNRYGGTITVTKRGRPVATVGPVRKRLGKSPEGAWAGKVQIQAGRLTSDMADLWDVVRETEEPPA